MGSSCMKASWTLRGLLLLTVAAPALAVSWGWEDGRAAFILYREPKLIAAAVLGWILVAARVWTWRSSLTADEAVAALRWPALSALAALVGYLALTGLWVRVWQNYFYELNQYVLLLALLAVLLIWSRREAAVTSWVRGALVASLAIVTGLGILQALVPLAVLTPIEPRSGVDHPSLMGYKNPAALALLGQIFLLAQLAVTGRKKAWRLGLGLLLAAEIAYLVSLESRTSYVALAAAAIFLIVLRLARHTSRRTMKRLAAAVAAVAVVTVLLASRDAARAYLATDRGTYLANTLNMARHHPFGVGLGDWQTQYPVFRKHNRDMSFSLRFQTRRAHSDHVQFLGEAGWPGLALWLAFLLLLAGGTARHYLRTGAYASLFGSAQVVALAVAMGTDYFVELPYHKLQLFLVAFLALASRDDTGSRPRRSHGPGVRHAVLLAIGISAVALLQIAYHVHLARKIHLAAAMEKSYLTAIERFSEKPDDPEGVADLRQVLGHGRQLHGLAGSTKRLHKTYLLLGHSAHLLGQGPSARAATQKALELHPYYPNAMRLMTAVAEDPESARRWRRAYEHVMSEATRGFEVPYPDAGPQATGPPNGVSAPRTTLRSSAQRSPISSSVSTPRRCSAMGKSTCSSLAKWSRARCAMRTSISRPSSKLTPPSRRSTRPSISACSSRITASGPAPDGKNGSMTWKRSLSSSWAWLASAAARAPAPALTVASSQSSASSAQ